MSFESTENEILDMANKQKIVQFDSDEERNMETIKSNFSCAICLSITEEPCMPPCGHLFCTFCLMQWIRSVEESQCPKCRSPFNTDSIVYISNGYSTKHRRNFNTKKKILKPGISSQNMRFGNIIIYKEESQKPTFINMVVTSFICLLLLLITDKIVSSI